MEIIDYSFCPNDGHYFCFEDDTTVCGFIGELICENFGTKSDNYYINKATEKLK